jgi:hypothetical protein
MGGSANQLTGERTGRAASSAARTARRAVAGSRFDFRRLRRLVVLSALIPLTCLVAQCGSAPNRGATANNAGDSFNDRFQAAEEHSFNDRFQSAEVFSPRQPVEPTRKRVASIALAQPKVAALSPARSYQRPPAAQELTTLVSLQSSAFPYLGRNPRTDEPFLNISSGDRRGHRANGRVYWQDETYSDNRVLVHIPKQFDLQKPGVIVVFFHGNGATLERDVRDRQLVPQQITDSGANAVLLAPQLAVDAADSSAGKFWQPGGLKRFLAESAEHLARLTGDPNAAKAFADMPVVIVAYSGGFVPAAYSLAVGGLDGRIRGVFLLDALYGELDKFADWIGNNRSAFFVSSYTRYTKRRDDELMRMLRDKGIRVAEDIDEPLRPGSVVFVQTPNGVTHRDYVTQAWTEHPVKDVLGKMAAMPALARVASRSVSR